MAFAICIVCVVVVLARSRKSDDPVCRDLKAYTSDFAARYAKMRHDSSLVTKLGLEGKAQPDSVAYKEMRTFGRSLFVNGDQTTAFEYLKNCVGRIEGNKDNTEESLKFCTYCYLLLGAATDEIGLYSLSPGYYMKGLSLSRQLKENYLYGDLLNNMGVSYYRSGQKENSEKYYLQALDFSRKEGNKNLMHIIYSNLSGMAADKCDYDKAIDYALKSIQCLDEKKDSLNYYYIQVDIGNLYILKNERQLAHTYITNACKHLLPGKAKTYQFEACMALITYHTKFGGREELAEYERKAEQIASETGNPQHLMRLAAHQAEHAAATGDMERAYRMERRIVEMKDSVYKIEDSVRIEQTRYIYNVERETENSRAGISGWNPKMVVGIAAILVAVLVSLNVRLVVMKRKKDAANRESADSIRLEAEKQLAQIDEERQSQAKMREELDMQHTRLTSFVLERLRINERVDGISTVVKQLITRTSSRDKETMEKLNTVLADINTLKTDTGWNDFHYYFEKVHPSFYKNLTRRHPELTPKDRRLCALLFLGLSSKDIASITFLEVRSVESSRNRLRKKLGLDADENLFVYIQSLADSQIAEEASTTTVNKV